MLELKVGNPVEVIPGNGAYPHATLGHPPVQGEIIKIWDAQTWGQGVVTAFVSDWQKTVLVFPQSYVQETIKGNIDDLNAVALLENWNTYKDLA